jgi:hypothetical protein
MDTTLVTTEIASAIAAVVIVGAASLLVIVSYKIVTWTRSAIDDKPTPEFAEGFYEGESQDYFICPQCDSVISTDDSGCYNCIYDDSELDDHSIDTDALSLEDGDDAEEMDDPEGALMDNGDLMQELEGRCDFCGFEHISEYDLFEAIKSGACAKCGEPF